MVCISNRRFKIISKKTIKNIITKNLEYEVIYTTIDDYGVIKYEIETDNNNYTSINAKYFMEVI